MKLGIHTSQRKASEAQWVALDIEGYEDNLKQPVEDQIRFLIAPQTRTLIDKAAKAVELRNKAGRKFRQVEGEGGEERELPGYAHGKDYAFTQEIAKLSVLDWQNVANSETGEDLECDDVNKTWLFENIDLAVWVGKKGGELAAVRIEDEVKN